MTRRTSLRTGLIAAVCLLTATVSAWAANEKVDVVVEVVHASDSGSTVDPPLKGMKDAFTKAGFNYKSYRRLSREKRTLVKSQASVVSLPNNQKATVTLMSVANNSAQVQVGVGPLKTTYTLGREGSLFIQAGPHNGGMLVLVLSPADH